MAEPYYDNEVDNALFQDLARYGQDTPIQQAILARRLANNTFGAASESGLDKFLWNYEGDPYSEAGRTIGFDNPERGHIEYTFGISGCTPDGGVIRIGIADDPHLKNTKDGYYVVSMDLEVGVPELWRVVDVHRSNGIVDKKSYHKVELVLSGSQQPEASEITQELIRTGDPVEDAWLLAQAVKHQRQAEKQYAHATIYRQGSERVGSYLSFGGQGQPEEMLTPLSFLIGRMAELEACYGYEKLYGTPAGWGVSEPVSHASAEIIAA